MAGERAPHVLIFEPDHRGHAHEWVLHLADYAHRHAPEMRLTFLVPGALADALPAGIGTIRLSPREEALCMHRRLAVSGFSRWWVMRRHLRRSGAGQGLFLGLDHLSLALALHLPCGRQVSGILFRPSVHYAGRTGATLKERVRDLRKHLLYALMLRHPALVRVHSLDDYFPDYARRTYEGGGKVWPLPDPAMPLVAPAPSDLALAARVPPGRKVLVLFGVLTARKGVLTLLEALARVSSEVAGRCAVVMAGSVDPPIREAVGAALAALQERRPTLWIRLEDRHLGTGELAALVERADVVLAPYQRFVGSSGVLMWAALRGRPVLTQSYGLLGRLAREHALGLAVDTSDAGCLAQAIEQAVTADGPLADRGRTMSFVASRTPEAFAAALLDPLRHGLLDGTNRRRGAEEPWKTAAGAPAAGRRARATARSQAGAGLITPHPGVITRSQGRAGR